MEMTSLWTTPRALLRGRGLPCGVAHKDLDNPRTRSRFNRPAGCPHSHRRYYWSLDQTNQRNQTARPFDTLVYRHCASGTTGRLRSTARRSTCSSAPLRPPTVSASNDGNSSSSAWMPGSWCPSDLTGHPRRGSGSLARRGCRTGGRWQLVAPTSPPSCTRPATASSAPSTSPCTQRRPCGGSAGRREVSFGRPG